MRWPRFPWGLVCLPPIVKQLILDLSLGAEPNLDNFVVGRNAEALQALRELVTGGLREPVVYLFGAPGSGRTHLLRAVVASYAQGRASYVGDDAGIAARPVCPIWWRGTT